jgi:hypothetical protein
MKDTPALEATMRPKLRDFRAHIEALDQRGLLVRLKHPINKDTELHPLVRLQFRVCPRRHAKPFCSKTSMTPVGRSLQSLF